MPGIFDFSGGGGLFADLWSPVITALQNGQFDSQGSNNMPGPPPMTNAQMFPGYGTNMGQGEAAVVELAR